MENVYYLKLVSGEDIIAKVDDSKFDDSDDVVIEDPVLVQYQATNELNYTAGMRPWIPGLPTVNEFTIDYKDIMIMCDVEEHIHEFYEKVVERNNETDYVHDTDEDESNLESLQAYSHTIH